MKYVLRLCEVSLSVPTFLFYIIICSLALCFSFSILFVRIAIKASKSNLLSFVERYVHKAKREVSSYTVYYIVFFKINFILVFIVPPSNKAKAERLYYWTGDTKDELRFSFFTETAFIILSERDTMKCRISG